MVRVRAHPAWYLLPLVVPALTLAAALPAPPGLTVSATLLAYLSVSLPALLFSFATTNWWEETFWTEFFQGPPSTASVPRVRHWSPLPPPPWSTSRWRSAAPIGKGLDQFGLILLITVPVRA